MINQPSTAPVPVPVVTDWWSGVKHQIAQVLNKVNLTLADVTQIVIFFSLGFFGGLLFRKYSRLVLKLIVGFVILFVIFDHFGFLMINWTRVQEFSGLNPNCTVAQCWSDMVGYIHAHLMVSISSLIGFLIGYGVG